MAKITEKTHGDWLPGSHEKVLEMADSWVSYITAERAAAWGIPAADLTAFTAKRDLARTKLAATTGENRGPKATEACNEAFDGLAADMRRLKKRHFFLNPLSGDDFIALNLQVPDGERTTIPVPTEDAPFSMKHGVFMQIVLRHGARPYGCNGALFRYVVLPPGSPEPSYEQLTLSRLLTRPVEYLEFDVSLKGHTLYGSLQWQQNKAAKGPPTDIQSIVLA